MPCVVQLVIRCGQILAVRERTLDAVVELRVCWCNDEDDTCGGLNRRMKKSKTTFAKNARKRSEVGWRLLEVKKKK